MLGVCVAEGVGLGAAVCVAVGDAVSVGLAVKVCVGVVVAVLVNIGVADAVTVEVRLGVLLGGGVAVALGCGWLTTSMSEATKNAPTITKTANAAATHSPRRLRMFTFAVCWAYREGEVKYCASPHLRF
jgi:hypothetical protein